MQNLDFNSTNTERKKNSRREGREIFVEDNISAYNYSIKTQTKTEERL